MVTNTDVRITDINMEELTDQMRDLGQRSNDQSQLPNYIPVLVLMVMKITRQMKEKCSSAILHNNSAVFRLQCPLRGSHK